MPLLTEYQEARDELYQNEQTWYMQQPYVADKGLVLTSGAIPGGPHFPKFYENLKILDSNGAESWITALRSNITTNQKPGELIYEVNLSGAGCKLHDYKGWMPSRASITQDYTVKEMYSNGTFNPMDDRNIYNCLPTEMEAMKEYVFDSIFHRDPTYARWNILNLTPTIYGKITLIKEASAPTASFQYSTDAVNWITWDADAQGIRTLVINHDGGSGYIPLGSTIYIKTIGRQTLSIGKNIGRCHHFEVPPYTIIGGCLDSLLTENDYDENVMNREGFGLANIFRDCSIIGTIRIKSKSIRYSYALNNAFAGCVDLRRVILETKDYHSGALDNWLDNTAGNAGVIYCPHDLQLNSGADGLPDGWTRIDI